MKYLLVFFCFSFFSASAQMARVGAMNRVSDQENEMVKKVEISASQEMSKSGFDTQFRFTIGFANEQKSYFFRLLEAKADLEKGFYHSLVFGEPGKYITEKELYFTFQDPVLERMTITGVWQYKGKEYKGIPMNIMTQNGSTPNRIFIQPPAKFSTNDILYGAAKLTDIEFNLWDIKEKSKLIDLVESQIKK